MLCQHLQRERLEEVQCIFSVFPELFMTHNRQRGHTRTHTHKQAHPGVLRESIRCDSTLRDPENENESKVEPAVTTRSRVCSSISLDSHPQESILTGRWSNI